MVGSVTFVELIRILEDTVGDFETLGQVEDALVLLKLLVSTVHFAALLTVTTLVTFKVFGSLVALPTKSARKHIAIVFMGSSISNHMVSQTIHPAKYKRILK